MKSEDQSLQHLQKQVEELRAQLAEARETLDAIQEGAVDALVVNTPQGPHIYTLQSAEQPYRLLIEQMREGAITLAQDGTIHYANRAFAEMVGRTLDGVVGSTIRQYVAEADRALFDSLVQQSQGGSAHGELSLLASDGSLVPVYLGLSVLATGGVSSICVVITDLTEQKRSEIVLASERFARAIVNQAADAIIVCDASGRFTFINAAARRMASLDPADATLHVVAEAWGQARDAEGRAVPAHQWPIALALKGQSIPARQLHLVRDDGSEMDVLISAAPLRDSAGSLIGAVATLTDISDRRAAELAVQRRNEELRAALEEIQAVEEELRAQNHELARSEEDLRTERRRYEDLFQFAPDAYLTTDLDGTIQEANRAATALFNVPENALIGVPLGLYVAPEKRSEFQQAMGRLRASDSPLAFELLMQPHQLPAFHAAITAAVTGQGTDDPGGCRWLIRDVSERKHVEEQLRKANHAKDHFLAALSHELRTPLTPALTAAQILEQDPRLPEELREPVSMIRRNAELETRLIDDLLDLTRIVRGKLELNFRRADVHREIQSVLEICDSDLHAKQQQLTVDLKAADHCVQADPARLQQVLWNLLKNAIKFTPVGGSIRIRTRNPQAGRLSVEISDNGVGIEPELLPRLFAAFEQGGRDITRQFGGLGLGLAISKALVESHGGTLTARSEGRNRGAVFTIRVPTSRQAQPEPTGTAGPGAAGRRGGGRILLVEDHEDTRRVMVKLLQLFGHEVQAADSVRAAMEIAERHEFDLVISDIGLPDGTGMDLMRRLLARRPVKGIALSGYGMEEDLEQSKAAGFVQHLVKPVNIAHFRRTVERLLDNGDTDGV